MLKNTNTKKNNNKLKNKKRYNTENSQPVEIPLFHTIEMCPYKTL